MKKKVFKFIVRKAIVDTYGKAGYTATAAKFLKKINEAIDRAYKKK